MKVFELLIDEEDDISGVQFLSIVKSPANQFEWEVFDEEEKPHDCSRHYDFSDKALDVFDKYGEEISSEWLFDAEHKDMDLTFEEFAAPSVKASPKSEDVGYDNPQTKVGVSRYIYVIDTGMGAPLIKTSRIMCRKMIAAQKVFRRQDINNLSRELTALGEESFKYVFRKKGIKNVDIFNYKFGKNDRHCWRELVFYKKPDESFDDLLKRIPSSARLGTRQADAVNQGSSRPFIAEARIGNGTGQLEMFSSEDRVKPIGFHMGLFLYRDKFSCMVGEPDAKYMSKIKIGEYEGWVGANVMDSYLEGTGKVVDKFKVKQNFVKVPEYIREVAERAVKWADENGWGSCGTAVGKRRANDLAKSDYDASIDVLTRMYSYGSRHKKDWESSDGFEDGCGDLMMAAWGLSRSNYDRAMKWLEGQINNATEMSVKFSSDEYKGDITAVVFEPDTKIYRYDPQTDQPYYVFMSRDTIEKLLKKFSRLKESGKLKNIVNYEHSDKVFSADDVYSYENWLVGDNPKEDKSYEIFGREMKPGTWITTLHFKNKDLFNEFVLSNRTTGISLEGLFVEEPFNFVKEEDFVKPRAGESEEDFIGRCMEALKGEFPDQDQRLAVCYSYYKEKFDDLEDACWPGYVAIGTKNKDGREVPNCVPEEMSEYLMSMLGIYGGAPVYSTEGEADQAAEKLGCKGSHKHEDIGFMPCATHSEAIDLYENTKLLFELRSILREEINKKD